MMVHLCISKMSTNTSPEMNPNTIVSVFHTLLEQQRTTQELHRQIEELRRQNEELSLQNELFYGLFNQEKSRHEDTKNQLEFSRKRAREEETNHDSRKRAREEEDDVSIDLPVNRSRFLHLAYQVPRISVYFDQTKRTRFCVLEILRMFMSPRLLSCLIYVGFSEKWKVIDNETIQVNFCVKKDAETDFKNWVKTHLS